MDVVKLPNMKPVLVEHSDMKLVGIPCIGLNDMGNKYQHAKESLLSSTPNLPQVVHPQVHYGIWPNSEIQNDPNQHVYILCVEVIHFEGISDWYVKQSLPRQTCVVVANSNGDFGKASKTVDQYVKENEITVSAEGREYIICERYNYEGEGFARYSLPIV